MSDRLARPFYARTARIVARQLLGKLLVSAIDRQRVSGFIVETEAYCDANVPDLACHGDRANQGRPTRRTQVMFGSAGYAYVYLAYGLHWMFNAVTGREGEANAVLVRALEPCEGLHMMTTRRHGRVREELTNGPGKLAEALGIRRVHNGQDLSVEDSVLWIEETAPMADESVRRGPRIGLGNTPEPWLSVPWRYWIADNKFVSR